MGSCKDEMKKPNTDDLTKKNKDKEGMLGFLARKRKTSDDVEDSPRKLANIIEEADKKIGDVIAQKTFELKSEKGDEDYNQRALAILNTIQYHIDEVIEKMADYAALKR